MRKWRKVNDRKKKKKQSEKTNRPDGRKWIRKVE